MSTTTLNQQQTILEPSTKKGNHKFLNSLMITAYIYLALSYEHLNLNVFNWTAVQRGELLLSISSLLILYYGFIRLDKFLLKCSLVFFFCITFISGTWHFFEISDKVRMTSVVALELFLLVFGILTLLLGSNNSKTQNE